MTGFLVRAIAVACCLLPASAANAHILVEGIGGFPGGFLHPLLVPEHALSLLALGLFIGRQDKRPRRIAWLVFVAGLVVGLLALALAVGMTPAGLVLLATTTLVALLIAVGWVPPQPASWSLAAMVGASLALDSPPDAVSIAEGILMIVGIGLGAALALVAVAEAAVYLTGNTEKIAVRVLASWIAASTILVLAFRVAAV